MKYTISYHTIFGSVSAEDKDLEELISVYPTLQELADRISKKAETPKISPKINLKKPEPSSFGVRETALIMRELESNLLPSKFFSKARTTGETRERLHEVTGKYFTSRKVSQALGILREKGQLRRTGKRNFYTYAHA
jgi:hypothetical protein